MEIVLIMLVLLIVLILLNVPIAYSIGVVSVFYFLVSDLSLTTFPQRMFSSVNSSTLFAVPLFLLAGILMNNSGITTKIYNFAYALIGHIKGGLAHVNVVSSMMFASMSGSGVADLVGLGTISASAMGEKGYKRRFAAALTLASSTITPIIPPSIILIIYGVTAEVSIGRLFLAGIIPGLVIGLGLMAYCYIVSDRKKFPIEERKASLRYVLKTFSQAILPLFTPILIVGGIIKGIFTATEAGAVAVVYVTFLGIFVYKQLNWKKIKGILLQVGVTASVILFLISTSGVMGWVMTMEQIPIKLAESLLGLTTNPIFILLLINLVILIAGMFLDATPVVLMLVPVLLPVINQIGVDPVQFGIIIGFNTMIGITTPPVGVGLYAMSSTLKVDVLDILREIWPMWLTLLIVLLLITFWPTLSLWLPSLVFG